MYFTLQPGTSTKRYKAVFYNRNLKKIKTTQFGHIDYDNFTIHKDEKRKDLYRRRDYRDKIDEPMSAGSLSWYLLWNKTALNESIQDYEHKFGIIYIDTF